MRTSPVLSLVGLLSAARAAVCAGSDAPAPDFARDVAPVFAKHCTSCHNREEKKGGLVLEDHASILAGGDGGPVVAAGKSAESRLLLLVAGKEKPKMPPGKRRGPSAAEIDAIRRWIDAGAPPPAAGGAESAAAPRLVAIPRIEPRAPVPSAVTALAYAPDGSALAVARHGRVELRDPAGQSLLRELACDGQSVNALRFSADGRLLAAGGGEPGRRGTVWLWKLPPSTSSTERAEGPALCGRLEGHRDAVYALALSADGRVLATGSYDATVELWDPERLAGLRTLRGHNGAVYGLDFRRDGKVLASASADRTAKLWRVEDGERLETLSQPLKPLHALAFAPDGTRVAAAGADSRIRVWQVNESGAEGSNPLLVSRFAHDGTVLDLAYSRSGRLLVSGASDRSVKVWDAAAMRELRVLEPQPDWPAALAVSPDEATIAVGRLDGTLGLYDATSGEPRRVATTGSRVSAAAGAAALAALIGAAVEERAAGVEERPAPAAKPEIAAIAPRGLERGSVARVELRGKQLAGVGSVKSSHPGVEARPLPLAPGDADDPEREIVEVRVGDDVPRGAYELSVVTPGGESGKVDLWVDDIPQHAEVEPNDRAATPAPLLLPAAVWGLISPAGDSDEFAFAGRAGATVVLDLAALRIGSKLDATLSVFAADGRLLASSNDFDGEPDPLLAVALPADGAYRAQVRDAQLGASDEHFYRLSIGEFAFVTACHPMSVPGGKETRLALAGYNLAPGEAVSVRAESAAAEEASRDREVTVPLDAARYRSRRELKLLVGGEGESVEVEPNDRPEDATPLPVPGAVAGRIFDPRAAGGSSAAATDTDCFRFEARRGERLVIETLAARRGSPVDTRIEVLDASGRPLERLLFHATRDSSITFRGIDSRTRDARLVHWEEMELDEYLYIEGEVVRLFRAPQGPDSGFLFYGADNGDRLCYFDTTATAHAFDAPCYIVEPHPPSARAELVPTGVPVFVHYYENDDDGERRGGRDSRLLFEAPADGEYHVRVSDSGGHGGDRFVYRLSVRPARPDFRVRLTGTDPIVPRGSGKGFAVIVERLDGFDGEVRVEIEGLPPGFTATGSAATGALVVEAGHREAQGTLYAASGALAPAPENERASRATARALIGGVEVVKDAGGLGTIRLGDAPKLRVFLEPWVEPAAAASSAQTSTDVELAIASGTTVPALLRVERNGCDDIVTFSVDNLPHGVIVDNIGLNGVLLPAGETRRQIFLTCAKWVRETVRTCHAVASQEGQPTSPPVRLRVTAPGAAAPETAAAP
jgi:hypothetical protein